MQDTVNFANLVHFCKQLGQINYLFIMAEITLGFLSYYLFPVLILTMSIANKFDTRT